MPDAQYWNGYDRILEKIHRDMEKHRYIAALRGIVELLQRTTDARVAAEEESGGQLVRLLQQRRTEGTDLPQPEPSPDGDDGAVEKGSGQYL